MRPLAQSLLVFSAFGLIASHISTGILSGVISRFSPRAAIYLDRYLNDFLVTPLGDEVSIYVVIGVGVFFALWTHMSARARAYTGAPERFSTW